MENKVLELWYKRKIENLKKEYCDFETNKYETLDVVKEYNEIVNNYNLLMEELAKKYPIEIIKTGYDEEHKYCVDDNIRDEIRNELRNTFYEEKRDITDLYEEIKAVLSISNDKEYQLNVLKQYEILDKEGMLIND